MEKYGVYFITASFNGIEIFKAINTSGKHKDDFSLLDAAQSIVNKKIINAFDIKYFVSFATARMVNKKNREWEIYKNFQPDSRIGRTNKDLLNLFENITILEL